MIKIGLRVVRGPMWSRDDEDGGDGGVGTLHKVDIENKIATVQWDNGNQTQCKIGHSGIYELRVLDNAQIGTIHERVRCDICKCKGIRGIRYNCNVCWNYDLCGYCYYNNKHELHHRFTCMKSSTSERMNLPIRSVTGAVHKRVSCDECNTIISGMRYKCNNCDNYDLCDFCYYGNKHNLRHTFKMIPEPNFPGIDIAPRSRQNQDVVHMGVVCDECNSDDFICGMRYQCKNCYNYDLCTSCYHGCKHDLNHSFTRFESPTDRGTVLPPRVVSQQDEEGQDHSPVYCNECSSFGLHGMRYLCNVCFDYDLCYSCYHGDKHDLGHSFTLVESPDSQRIHLPPRLISRKCQLKGIFKGARVIRGIDWKWKNQDGGKGKPGVVLNITRWHGHKSWRSAAYVKWDHGSIQLCRLGFRGNCDLQLVEISLNYRYCYPEHLPILGLDEIELMQILNVPDIQEDISHTESVTNAEDTLDFASLSLNAASSSDEHVKQLEKKLSDIEEAITCGICWENRRDVVFLCGHGACSACAESLQCCHMCRKTIQTKIRIF